ncbi:uncharacterized protein VTP21DRAFT_10430 [Calcarisporiella thermophila]|uniref:uncharacterized protein n=1 Tax=Calcarisporiella thermophila TaxID=911321 RepID=UPI0037449AF1
MDTKRNAFLTALPSQYRTPPPPPSTASVNSHYSSSNTNNAENKQTLSSNNNTRLLSRRGGSTNRPRGNFSRRDKQQEHAYILPKLDTPEEIAKWIEERKKNWPTEERIEQKKKDETERIARGEIVESRKRRRNQSYNEKNQNVKKNKTLNSENTEWVQYELHNQNGEKRKDNESAPDKNSDNANPNSIFKRRNEGDEITGEEQDDENEDMDPVRDAISSKDPVSIGGIEGGENSGIKPRKLLPCKYFLRGHCTRGSSCSFLHDSNLRKRYEANKSQEKFRERPSLLTMLLSKEIKEEKSILLQCLHYIVKKEFFGNHKNIAK